MDAKTWIATSVVSAGALSYSARKTKELLNDRQLPTLGIMSAFIFAGQMVNFPVAGGTSGHLLGAALATILLGPWSACLVISTVLIIQCLFFQDGGITALGANIFNMAVAGVAFAYYLNRLLTKIKLNSYVTSFIVGWTSVMVASLLASMELAISNTIAFKVVFPAMAGVHSIIGIGEGLITAVVVAFVVKTGDQAGRNEINVTAR